MGHKIGINKQRNCDWLVDRIVVMGVLFTKLPTQQIKHHYPITWDNGKRRATGTSSATVLRNVYKNGVAAITSYWKEIGARFYSWSSSEQRIVTSARSTNTSPCCGHVFTPTLTLPLAPAAEITRARNV